MEKLIQIIIAISVLWIWVPGVNDYIYKFKYLVHTYMIGFVIIYGVALYAYFTQAQF